MIFASSLKAFARPAAFSSSDSPPIILASVLAGGAEKFDAFVFEPAAPVAAAVGASTLLGSAAFADEIGDAAKELGRASYAFKP